MARARAGGGGAGWAVATVLLGFGFIISLILAIVFRTQINGVQQALDQERSDQRTYVTVPDRASPDVTHAAEEARAAEGRPSVVQYLITQNRALKGLIMGRDESLQTIETRVRGALAIAAGRTLVEEVEALRDNLEREGQAVVAAEKALAEEREKVQRAEQEKSQLDEGYVTAVAGVREDVVGLRSDFVAFQADTAGQITELESHLEAERKRVEDELKAKSAAIQRLEAEKDDLEQRIVSYAADPGSKRPGVVEGVEADGEVVSLTNDRDLVYVDLARNDRVLPGMTFEVFDRDMVIKLSDAARPEITGRGKATLEIVRVLDTASVARVVRRELRAVLAAGDQIVNLAYDRNAVYRFFVHGRFDIDNIGRATMADRERIKAMIERWGGKVPDEVTYQTDFLVLGESPRLPDRPGGEAGPEILEAYQKQLRTYQEHQKLVAQAEKLEIPVLNQNRFLSLVGYYRR